MDDSNSVLEVNELRKVYGKQIALNNVNFRVCRGELVSLVGANGAGKSTLMKLLMRQEVPESGEAKILGTSIHEDSSDFNARVGYVSESVEFNLPISMNAITDLYSKLFPKWDQNLFDGLKNQFKLETDKTYHQVSRGQQMHFVFALALSIKPEILLLDEVTAVMDPWARLVVMNRLKEFAQQGGAVVLATNILSEIQNFAHRIIVMGNGSILLDIPVSELGNKFSKIRLHPSFAAEVAETLGDFRETVTNSDGTISYIVPRDVAKPIEGALPDHRSVTAEDLFIYYSRKGA